MWRGEEEKRTEWRWKEEGSEIEERMSFCRDLEEGLKLDDRDDTFWRMLCGGVGLELKHFLMGFVRFFVDYIMTYQNL